MRVKFTIGRLGKRSGGYQVESMEKISNPDLHYLIVRFIVNNSNSIIMTPTIPKEKIPEMVGKVRQALTTLIEVENESVE